MLDKANQYVTQERSTVNPFYRNKYHAMAPIGWINDPNGFIYFKNEYHLFYQYNPFDSKWGPMYWGHLKSKDLIHWEDLPIALAPDQWYDKDGCFSGSAIEKDGKLYLMYTGHAIENNQVYQRQCMAVSEDGVVFSKFDNNPVIDDAMISGVGSIHDFRDPKVIYRNNQYYTVVATKNDKDAGRALLFESSDLLKWRFKSILLDGEPKLGIMFECPDLFSLDGWDVLLMSMIQMPSFEEKYHNISSTVAFIGKVNWDTGKFITNNYDEIDSGLDFYAPQTTLNDQNQRIMIAWMQMWDRTIPTHDLGHHWSGSMTFPRELQIKDRHLIQKPVNASYSNLKDQFSLENIVVGQYPIIFHNVARDNEYICLTVNLADTEYFEMRYPYNGENGLKLAYDVRTETFTFSREGFGYLIKGNEKVMPDTRTVKVPLVYNQLVLEVFRDTSSIEIFINGKKTVTATFYEKMISKDILFAAKGRAVIKSLKDGSVNV